MVRELTLRQVGGSIDATIPKDMADRMNFEAGLAVAAHTSKKCRNALRELAKKRMVTPRWIPWLVLDAAHLDQLREHGGLLGTRDEHALEATLARPQQKRNYEPDSDLATLVAAYAFGLANAHPFNDGNKRAAFRTAMIFLGLNGKDLDATEA